MSSVAIITARGGSKRIPKKNIKLFCGKPIIAYSIEAALESGCFDEVMVSTDSVEIASIASEYGAKIPFLRSAKTSNDIATTADVIKEVLDEYANKQLFFDYFCCIYPTAPFVTAAKLQDAFFRIKKTDADCVMPVVSFSFPPQRAFVIRDEKIQYQYPEYRDMRSQDLEPIYHDCGQFYFCKTNSFNINGALVTNNTYPLIISELEVQDIDNESDWKLAEIKYQNMLNQ